MWTNAIDDLGVYQSVTLAGCAKTAERIDVLFGMETPGNPRNTILDGVSIPNGDKGGLNAAFVRQICYD